MPTTLPAGWKPIESAPKNQLVMVYTPPQPSDWPDTVRIGFDYIDAEVADDYWYNHGEHYEHYCCVAKPENCTGPQERAPYTHWMPLPAAPGTPPATTQDAPITVSLDPDPRGVSVGVWQGSHCIYNGAHAVPVAQDDAKDEQAAFEEWLERTCPSGDVEAVQRQWEASSDYADFHAPAAGDARDAARYRTWRDAMVAEDTEFRLTVAAALPSEVGDTRPPTSAEWDAGIDAAIAAQQGKGGGA